MKYTEEQIFKHIQSTIAKTLRISTDEVKMDSVLGEELGAESLDFVDIQFQLEIDYKISLYEGSLLERLSELMGSRSDVLSENGKLTELGAEILRARMPEIDSSKIFADMPLAGIEALYTAASWVRVVKELLDVRPQSCSNCCSENLRAVRPSVLICEACRKEMTCPTQEQLLTLWVEKFSKSRKNNQVPFPSEDEV